MAKKKARGYRIRPPYISLGNALAIAKKVYTDAGGSASEDDLSAIVANSVKSSSFQLKLQSLKNYGLVNQEGQGKRISLTEPARRFFGATSPEQRAQAQKAIFLSVGNYQKLYDLWAGQIIPTGEFIHNAIKETCKVPADRVPDWQESFVRAAEAAGLLLRRSDGSLQLRREPNGLRADVEREELLSRDESDEKSERPGKEEAPPRRTSDTERYQIPLLDGKVGVIELPKGWTTSDVRKFLHVVNAMFLWGEGEKPEGGAGER
jgi:hypothetical protein